MRNPWRPHKKYEYEVKQLEDWLFVITATLDDWTYQIASSHHPDDWTPEQKRIVEDDLDRIRETRGQ